jgi:hypothetical protein
VTDFDGAVRGFAALDEDALGRPWTWRGGTLDVRNAVYWTLGEGQDAQVRVAAAAHPESRRILALAQRALGDLRGLLAGLPADLLDATPRAGQWSIRQTLAHVLLVELRYAAQTIYALERADADPVRIPEAQLPAAGQAEASGDAAALVARLGQARAATDRRLGDVPAAAMTRPTRWGPYDVDVRFRLHRFAVHLAEHTVQCEKTLAALGWRQTEGRRIVRLLTAALGELEGLGALVEVRDLEARLAERFASVTTGPAAG